MLRNDQLGTYTREIKFAVVRCLKRINLRPTQGEKQKNAMVLCLKTINLRPTQGSNKFTIVLCLKTINLWPAGLAGLDSSNGILFVGPIDLHLLKHCTRRLTRTHWIGFLEFEKGSAARAVRRWNKLSDTRDVITSALCAVRGLLNIGGLRHAFTQRQVASLQKNHLET